jgi:ArsR family transcriptional regulator
MIEGDELSRLLDILGNRNRRRIIQLLRQKPCFVTEISERLMISPKAVIEHLQLMEREHVLFSHSDEGRRKYYYLSRDIDVKIHLHNQPAMSFRKALNDESRFFNSLIMLKRMLGAREKLLDNLEYLDRDIDRKIQELLKFGKGLFLREEEINLLINLLTYDLTFEELEELTSISRQELLQMLNDLTTRGIVERRGEYYRARDFNATQIF